MEVYDHEFSALVTEKIGERKGAEITLAALKARSLPIRLRDSAARLLLPYL
jgi:cardiolipin synthase